MGMVAKKRKIQKTNSQFWNSIKKKCNQWVKKTSPTEASFCFLYWKSVRGHHEVIWQGPEHMRSFVEDKNVHESFKRASLKMPSFTSLDSSKPNLPESAIDIIVLRSSNPDDYRNDVLAKIIFKILNPLGKRGNFYDDVANCPSWFPPLVKFRRPNHPKVGEKRMTANEMRTILGEFLKHCPDHYKIVDEEEKNIEENYNGANTNVTVQQDDNFDQCDPENQDDANIPHTNESSKQMTCEEALMWCSAANDWEEFNMRVLNCKSVDISFLSESHIVNLDTSQSPNLYERIDWRRKGIFEKKLPEELMPGISSGEGDCLFCSISVLLFGNEKHSKDLRFASMQYALKQFDHYFQMLTAELGTIDDALQFCATVVSDEEIINSNAGTIESTIKLTLQAEIISTAKIGCYSGLLQILFLSGVTNCSIQQYCEVERDGYGTTLYPALRMQ